MDVLHSAHSAALRPASGRRPPDSSLRGELAAAYTDLPREVVTAAWDRAYEIEQGLAAGADVTPVRVAMLARDRLDVLRRRASTAPRPIGDRPLPAPARPQTDGASREGLACTYCRHPLTADSFEYLSGIRRLVSASCPICERRTTVRASTWIRLNAPGQPDQPGARTRP